MLHSKVYNLSLTPEALEAYRLRDADRLKAMIMDQIPGISSEDPEFREKIAILMCTISLYDSLKGGDGCMLIADFINF